MSSTPKCKICGRSNVPLNWCGLCKSYFCAECEKDYPARIAGFMKEAKAKIFGRS